jgi:hydroxyacylglutathione hydrolase
MRPTVVIDDILVFTSAVWQTTCTVIRSGDSTLVIDSPVFPHEHEAIPPVLAERGFSVDRVQLFTTHGDWDHVLGPLMFPEAPLWCGQSTADRFAADPEDLPERMRSFDETYYVKRSQPLRLDRLEPLSVPGEVTLGGLTVGLIKAHGHTVDGTAALVREPGVLAVGDYLSPVELPRLRGSLEAHFETLDRLEVALAETTVLVPGHGHPISRDAALKILAEDRSYFDELRDRGVDAALPSGRDDGEQQRVHREINVPTAAGAT